MWYQDSRFLLTMVNGKYIYHPFSFIKVIEIQTEFFYNNYNTLLNYIHS